MVLDPVPLYDSAAFEHLQRIAMIMARSSLIPDALRKTVELDDDGEPVKDNGKNVMRWLAPDEVVANCFLVVEQASRWGSSPFAVAQCLSLVRGKLVYEGKLIAGILDAKLGVMLNYAYNDKTGDAFGVIVSGQLPGEAVPREVDGTVGAWKTLGNRSAWSNPTAHKRMLAYRGAREWARRHKPSILLGVYTDDEFEDLQTGRSSVIRGSITPVDTGLGAPAPVRQIANQPAVAMTVETQEIAVRENAPPLTDRDDGAAPGAQQAASPQPGPGAAPTLSTGLDSPEIPGGDEGAAASQEGAAAPEIETTEGSSTSAPARRDEEGPAVASQAGEPAEHALKPSPEDAPADIDSAPLDPHDDASYKAHVFRWAGRAKDAEAAQKQWRDERALRTKLNLTAETVEACRAFLASAWSKKDPVNGGA